MTVTKLLDTCREHDCWLGTTDRGTDLLLTLHRADPLAAASLVGHELSKIAAEQAEYQAHGAAGPVTVAAVEAVAEKQGIPFEDAAALIDLDWQEKEALLELGPQSSPVAWLDTTPLVDPPRPWSEEDWQRDSRRAMAAGIELPRSSWEAYAEDGLDAVTELIRERVEARLKDIRWRRARLADAATSRALDKAQAERDAKAAAAAAARPNYINI